MKIFDFLLIFFLSSVCFNFRRS